VHCIFFHNFIEYGSIELFAKHVVMPQSNEAAMCPEYDAASLAGCIGSMDATHVMCKKVFQCMRNAHIGFKMSQTARTYNLIVNHARRILSTSQGHPGSWNDKTVVLFDNFASRLHDSTILNHFSFSLLEWGVNGTVIDVQYKGAWLIVDNGYLNWLTTVPPIKQTIYKKEIRWSQWVKSVRKDVECTFGILKGCFQILKSGI